MVVDHLPPEVSLYVGDLPDHPGTSPILFEPMDSGLDFDYGGPGAGTDDVDFSDDDGNTWDYVPSAGSDGVDPAVDAIRFQPSGTMAPGAQVGVGFRGRVQ